MTPAWGQNAPEPMLPLCSAHHRAVHDGRLVISGTCSEGFVFTHADGSAYGTPAPDPTRSKVLAEVFQYLCAMGFRQREARQLLDEGGPHVRAHEGVEEALRTILRRSSTDAVREAAEAYGAAELAPSLPWPDHGAFPPRRYVATGACPAWAGAFRELATSAAGTKRAKRMYWESTKH